MSGRIFRCVRDLEPGDVIPQGAGSPWVVRATRKRRGDAVEVFFLDGSAGIYRGSDEFEVKQ